MRKYLLSLLSLCVVVATCLGDFKPTATPVNGSNRAVLDSPVSEHIRNIAGVDGSGLCVFTSVEVAAKYQNVQVLFGFQKFMATKEGGGWPEKLDAMIAEFTNKQFTRYVQHTGGDASFLDAAMSTGRAVSITYDGRDDFYGRRTTIAHMVNLAYLDSQVACIIDNNRPDVWVWMTRAELLSRWSPRRDGWAVVLLDSPPPPYPDVPKAYGQCMPNGYCYAEWQGKPGLYGVFRNNVFLGTWDVEKQTWDQVTPCPPIPEHLQRAKPLIPLFPLGNKDINFGVNRDKLREELFSCGGKKCTREEAMDVILFDDDSSLPYLTVVGDNSLFLRVKSDVDTLGLTGKVHLQLFSPGSWQQVQFKLPDGVSLRKPAKLVRVSQEVGKIAPGLYDAGSLRDLLRLLFPNLPPGPSSPLVPTPRVAINVDFWTLLLIGAGLYFFTRQRTP